jgi:hypothetical protein
MESHVLNAVNQVIMQINVNNRIKEIITVIIISLKVHNRAPEIKNLLEIIIIQLQPIIQ